MRDQLPEDGRSAEGGWIQAIIAQLRVLHFFEWTNIGLNRQGAHIVRNLFRSSPTHAVVPIATGLLLAFVGVIAVVVSLQVLYERIFLLEHRGWRDLPRYFAYVVILLASWSPRAASMDQSDARPGPWSKHC